MRSDQRKTWILLAGVALSSCFLLFLIAIVSPHGPFAGLHFANGPAPWGQIAAILATRRSAFIYETILAGMLGAYLGELSRVTQTDWEPRDGEISRFAAALFMGAGASVVVGVLAPLVVLGEEYFNLQSPANSSTNHWTLVVAGGLAANYLRSSLSQIENAIARLASNIEPKLDPTVISENVKLGVQEAFSVPAPIQYEGTVAAKITRFNESVLQWSSDSWLAPLTPGESFALTVQFFPSGKPGDSAAVSAPIRIREGTSRSTVPFRLFVDFGFPDLPPEEREIEVPAHDVSSVESFPFVVPKQATPDKMEGKRAYPREASVSIYQHTRYFDSCVVAVSIGT